MVSERACGRRTYRLAVGISLAAWWVAAAGTSVLHVALGTPKEEVAGRLKDLDLRAAVTRSDITVAGPVIPDVFAVQHARFVFAPNDRLTAVTIQIRPDPGSNGRDLLDLWDDVRHELIRQLGAPTWERDEVPPGDPLAALAERRLVKLVQWEGERTVRLGIPHRVDGEVLIEIWVTHEHLPRTLLSSDDPIL